MFLLLLLLSLLLLFMLSLVTGLFCPGNSPLETTVTPPLSLQSLHWHGASSGCRRRNDLQYGRVSEICL
jgi:hypothetical protein